MTTEAPPRLLTAEEFYLLSDPPEGGKMELVRGKVVHEMPPGGAHGIRVSRIDRRLGAFIEAHHLGASFSEAGFLLSRSPDVVRAPDFAFAAKETLPELGIPEEGWLDFVPTLAVEVISPNDRDGEIQEKLSDYEAAGVKRIWVVRPRNGTITVMRSDGPITILRSGDWLTSEEAAFAVPEFKVAVDDLLHLE